MLRFLPLALLLLVFISIIPSSSSSFLSTSTGAFYLDWVRGAASLQPEMREKRATSHSTNWGKRAAGVNVWYPKAASKRILLLEQDDRGNEVEEQGLDTGFGEGVYRTNIAHQHNKVLKQTSEKIIQFVYNLGKIKTSGKLKKAREEIIRWFFGRRFPRYRGKRRLGKRRLGMIQKSSILPSDVNFCNMIQELSRRVCLYFLRHSVSSNLQHPQLCEGLISRCFDPGSKRQIGQISVPGTRDGAGKKYRKIFVRI